MNAIGTTSPRRRELKIVEVPTIKVPVAESPGFAKKRLSDYKLDIMGLCEFGCRYCNSNHGNYLRIWRKLFAELTRQQTGATLTPLDDPELVYVWPEILQRLEGQLAGAKKSWGRGRRASSRC
jgi:hypothetical protein